jgi:AraC family transcriptional regulator
MLRSLDGSTPVVNAKPVRTRDYSIELQRSGPATLPAFYHNLHLVTVALSGESVVLRGSPGHHHPVRLTSGDSSIRPAGPGQQVTWPDGIHCLHVHLHPRLVRRLGAATSAEPGTTLQFRSRLRDHIIGGIGFELFHMTQATGPIDRQTVDRLVMALAHHVVAAYPAPEGAPLLIGTRTVEEVFDLFRERTVATGGVETVAGWCGLSRPHFSRRLRALTGLWPQTMILGSRIEAAKHLLERDGGSLSEVAYTSGFADQSHLTRAFRRATGLTPGKYRITGVQDRPPDLG